MEKFLLFKKFLKEVFLKKGEGTLTYGKWNQNIR